MVTRGHVNEARSGQTERTESQPSFFESKVKPRLHELRFRWFRDENPDLRTREMLTWR